MSAPLAGVKILDLTRLLPGPFATCLLADLGADVAKVEPPGGDYMRVLPPLVNEQSSLFLGINRNKRGIVLDLKTDAGRDAFRALLKTYDVLVEGFRPGVMTRLGLDYQALRQVQPKLIYASLSGYGQTGPYRDRAGHDLNYLALSGGGSMTGLRDGRLAVPAMQPADISGALYLASAVLAKIVQRLSSGEGGTVDVALADTVRALHTMVYSEYFASGETPGPAGTIFTGKYVCYDLYRTKDERWMSLGALEDKFWQAFVNAASKPHLSGEGFSETASDNPVKQEMDALFASRTQAEWVKFLDGVDCCCEPVLDLAEASRHEQAQARGAICESEHPTEGKINMIAQPMALTPPLSADCRPAPALGEHTDQILREAGIDETQIAAWKKQGAFG